MTLGTPSIIIQIHRYRSASTLKHTGQQCLLVKHEILASYVTRKKSTLKRVYRSLFVGNSNKKM
jgi:hypothetical protein